MNQSLNLFVAIEEPYEAEVPCAIFGIAVGIVMLSLTMFI